jgi:hypothetical protein
VRRNPNDVDADAYNSVVGRTELRGIRLTESRFELKPDALQIDPSSWRYAMSNAIVEAFVDEENGALHGFLQYEAIVRHRRKRILFASARYMVSYEVDGECPPELGALFIERVGRIAAYPYFRGLVASLVAQAGIVMPPLPVISFAPRSLASAANLQSIASKPKEEQA